jgi:hypothetical protein
VAEWLKETQAAERFAQWEGEFKRVEAVRYHFAQEIAVACSWPLRYRLGGTRSPSLWLALLGAPPSSTAPI